jgi:hypothetical protein
MSSFLAVLCYNESNNDDDFLVFVMNGDISFVIY